MTEAGVPPLSPISLRAAATNALALNDSSPMEASNEVLDPNSVNFSMIRNVNFPKLPDISSTSSDSDGNDDIGTQTTQMERGDLNAASNGRISSPPPNCAICLGRCKNKCFTDSCPHQFCFKCLCEWSKVKPECPLCKKTFKSIIHNVKSMSQFERYHVPPPTVQIPNRSIQVAYRSMPIWVDVNGRILPAENVQSPIIHSGSLDMYSSGISETITPTDSLSRQWRRYVYDRKLHAMPVCDITGRFRESNARFYRDNPTQIHRLMSWINRDIFVLLRNTSHDVTTVLERIKETLSLVNILSPAFRRRLQPFLGNRTAHFIHELNNFARSPYDIIGYDRAVQYSTLSTEEVIGGISTSESSDEDTQIANNENVAGHSRLRNNAINGTNGPRTHARATNSTLEQPPMMNFLSFTISSTSEGVEAPGVSSTLSERSGQSAAINLSTHNRGEIIDLDSTERRSIENVPIDESTVVENLISTSSESMSGSAEISTFTSTLTEPQLISSITPAVYTGSIEVNSSSSDECEFVLERKPPHLRTPELVSLNSESDSDVVFVKETQLLRNTANSSDTDLESFDSPNKIQKQSFVKYEQETFNVGASTSTGIRCSKRKNKYNRDDDNTDNCRPRKQLRKRRSERHQKNMDRNNLTAIMSQSSETSSESDERDEKVTRSNVKNSKHREIGSDKNHSRRSRKIKKKLIRKSKTCITSSEEDDSLNLQDLKKRLVTGKTHENEIVLGTSDRFSESQYLEETPSTSRQHISHHDDPCSSTTMYDHLYNQVSDNTSEKPIIQSEEFSIKYDTKNIASIALVHDADFSCKSLHSNSIKTSINDISSSFSRSNSLYSSELTSTPTSNNSHTIISHEDQSNENYFNTPVNEIPNVYNIEITLDNILNTRELNRQVASATSTDTELLSSSNVQLSATEDTIASETLSQNIDSTETIRDIGFNISGHSDLDERSSSELNITNDGRHNTEFDV